MNWILSFRLAFRRQLHHQWPFIPENKAVLVHPVLVGLIQFHIKIENHARKDDSHLDISQAVD